MTPARVDPLSPLLLSVLFLTLASLFVCGCGFLIWEALFGTMPAVIFAWRGLLRANALLREKATATHLVALVLAMVVATIAGVLLGKTIADVVWLGHDPLLPLR